MQNRIYAITLATSLLCSACGTDLQPVSDISANATPSNDPTSLHETQELAGTRFTIDVMSLDVARAQQAMAAAFTEVARLEGVVSEWREESEISAINAAAGHSWVTVSAELYGVLNRAMWFAEITSGAFDPSFAACAQLWSIPEQRIPGARDLTHCRQRTGYRNIQLDMQTSAIRFNVPGMRIGLGGIGKGYRVDRAADVLEAWGLTSYVVNGGGDIRVASGPLHGPWRIEIAHPRTTELRLGSVTLSRGAIATSGDSSWYFDEEGVRYHHIFDPRTGAPARQSIAVTVIAERAMDADALATGLFVLGPEQGLALLARLPGYEALLVGPDLINHKTPGFPPFTDQDLGEF